MDLKLDLPKGPEITQVLPKVSKVGKPDPKFAPKLIIKLLQKVRTGTVKVS